MTDVGLQQSPPLVISTQWSFILFSLMFCFLVWPCFLNMNTSFLYCLVLQNSLKTVVILPEKSCDRLFLPCCPPLPSMHMNEYNICTTNTNVCRQKHKCKQASCMHLYIQITLPCCAVSFSEQNPGQHSCYY